MNTRTMTKESNDELDRITHSLHLSTINLTGVDLHGLDRKITKLENIVNNPRAIDKLLHPKSQQKKMLNEIKEDFSVIERNCKFLFEAQCCKKEFPKVGSFREKIQSLSKSLEPQKGLGLTF